MPFELGLSDTGLVVPRTNDFIAEIDARYEAITGIALDSANPANSEQQLVILVGIMAELLDDLAQGTQAVYDGLDPDAAGGVQASNIAKITGTERKVATPSTVTLTCTGTDGTALPSGRVAEGGGPDGLARWESIANATITGGSVDVEFQAQVAGATAAEPGTIATIVTPVVGWDAVTNASKAAIGLNDEDDGALKLRRRQGIARGGGLGVPAVRAKLLALDFIEAAVILANGDSETKVIQGVSMGGNTWLAVVLPSQLTTPQQQTVLDTLYATAPMGAEPAGTDLEGTVVGIDGFAWPMSFDFGGDITVTLAFTLTLELGVSLADATAALDALIQPLVPLDLGEDVLQLVLCGLAAQVSGIRRADVLINGVDNDLEVQITQRVAAFTVTTAVP